MIDSFHSSPLMMLLVDAAEPGVWWAFRLAGSLLLMFILAVVFL